MIAVKCLDKATIDDLVAGRLPKERFEEALQHVDSCPRCAEMAGADSAAKSDSIARELQSIGSLRDDFEHESHCQIAVGNAMMRAVEGPRIGESPAAVEHIGPYRLRGQLGLGGMGTVYLAEHQRLKRMVAIKLLPRDKVHRAGWLDRFNREMTTVAAFEHPNVVRALDAGESDGWHYLVMEYLEGLDLARVVRRVPDLSVSAACEVIRQAALGLAAIHEKGLVHRDIKPSNLFLTYSGAVKLLDLGLVLDGETPLETDERLTTVGHLMGTLPYMAREQLSDARSVSATTDIYALGATFHRLLFGVPPFGRLHHLPSLIQAISTQDIPTTLGKRGDVNVQVSELIDSMLSHDPAKRPQTAAALAEQLQPFCDPAAPATLIGVAMRSPESHDEATHADTYAIRPAVAATIPPSRIGRWLGWAMLPIGILAGVLLTIFTDNGVLRIETDQADVAVRVLQGQHEVSSLVVERNKPETLTLRSGTYAVELTGIDSNEMTISDNRIAITRGGEEVVKVTRKVEGNGSATLVLDGASDAVETGIELNAEIGSGGLGFEHDSLLSMSGHAPTSTNNLSSYEPNEMPRLAYDYLKALNELQRSGGTDSELEVQRLKADWDLCKQRLESMHKKAELEYQGLLADYQDVEPMKKIGIGSRQEVRQALQKVEQAKVDLNGIEFEFRWLKDFETQKLAPLLPKDLANSDSSRKVFNGKTFDQWLELLKNDRDVETIGAAMKALSLLAETTEQKRSALREVFVVARIYGGMVAGGEDDSQRFMNAFSEHVKVCFPNPGFDIVSEELKSGNRNSWLAIAFLGLRIEPSVSINGELTKQLIERLQQPIEILSAVSGLPDQYGWNSLVRTKIGLLQELELDPLSDEQVVDWLRAQVEEAAKIHSDIRFRSGFVDYATVSSFLVFADLSDEEEKGLSSLFCLLIENWRTVPDDKLSALAKRYPREFAQGAEYAVKRKLASLKRGMRQFDSMDGVYGGTFGTEYGNGGFVNDLVVSSISEHHPDPLNTLISIAVLLENDREFLLLENGLDWKTLFRGLIDRAVQVVDGQSETERLVSFTVLANALGRIDKAIYPGGIGKELLRKFLEVIADMRNIKETQPLIDQQLVRNSYRLVQLSDEATVAAIRLHPESSLISSVAHLFGYSQAQYEASLILELIDKHPNSIGLRVVYDAANPPPSGISGGMF